MDTQKLIASLHPLERKVLPVLNKHKTVSAVQAVTGLKEVEVTRAFQWLENKKLATTKLEKKEFVLLDKNGEHYKKSGLPERKFLAALKGKEVPVPQLVSKTGLTKDEVNVCLGLLRTKAAILLSKDKGLRVKLTTQGRSLFSQEWPEERFLQRSFPVELSELSADEREAFKALKARKNIVSIEIKKLKSISLTALGKKLIAAGVRDETVIDRLTAEMLRTGEWEKKTFRRYDIQSSVPRVSGGKFQHYRHFLDHVRKKFLSLGFAEMTGPLVETDFWDMDALYMPQFHSARDIHEAYYVKEPKKGSIDKKVLQRVKDVHERGGKTGSTGWGYSFDAQRTQRLLLRTQGTACSARMLANPDLQIPGKYFGLTRCFRYDVIDATHLPDFNQTEGIVIGENLNLRHLFGLLEMFAKEFAEAEQIKIVPGYFPFTEPSAELFAKHPELGWMELGGAGMFRPEVVQPLLGKHVPVLAWGLGIDRIGMFKLGIRDIRHLFTHDLDVLRTTKVI